MMKKNELALLAHLRRNARETLTKISRETRMPVSTIFDRLKKYDNDIIKKSTVLLDFAKLGYNTRVTLMLRVPKHQRDKLRDFLIKENRVNSFSKINNNFDFLLECIFKSMHEFQDFIECLEEKFDIRDKQIYYILDDIKKEDFMSNPNSPALAIG